MFEVVGAVRDAVVSEPSRFPADGTDLHRRNNASGRNRIGMIFEIGQVHRRKYNAIPAANFSYLINAVTGQLRAQVRAGEAIEGLVGRHAEFINDPIPPCGSLHSMLPYGRRSENWPAMLFR